MNVADNELPESPLAGTDREGVPIPDRAELLRRARALMPGIAARAMQGERDRKVAAESIAEIRDAGLFRILQPRRWGGYELDLRTFFEVQMTLAEGDMSTGWVFGTLGIHQWLLAVCDDHSARDVWGTNPDALIASSTQPVGKAVSVDGGFLFSTRGAFSSGCNHSDWISMGGMVEGANPPDRRLFMVPRRDFSIDENWHAAGLKATGSHDVVVNQAFVPEYHTRRWPENFACTGAGLAVNTGPLYRFPFGQIFVRWTNFAALGALRGMLNHFIEHNSRRPSLTQGSGKARDDPGINLVCAETDTAIDQMRIFMFAKLDELAAYAARGEIPPIELRARHKYQMATVGDQCAALAARLFKFSGAVALSNQLPFGRFLVDITAARQHITCNADAFGRSWGAVLLGADQKISDFL